MRPDRETGGKGQSVVDEWRNESKMEVKSAVPKNKLVEESTEYGARRAAVLRLILYPSQDHGTVR